MRAGQRVLDVAAGSGATSIPAALAGGDVVASDLTPELLAVGEAAARERGLELEWVEADAEALPFEDASFDVVLSSFGAIFAPRHQVVAGELLRVARPGATIAMANWPPEGWVGQFFLTMLPFMPPPPPGATPPLAWGVEDHVRSLFGDGVERADVHAAHPAGRALRDAGGAHRLLQGRTSADDHGLQVARPAIRSAPPSWTRRCWTSPRRMNLAGPGEPARFEFEYVVVVARRA